MGELKDRGESIGSGQKGRWVVEVHNKLFQNRKEFGQPVFNDPLVHLEEITNIWR